MKNRRRKGRKQKQDKLIENQLFNEFNLIKRINNIKIINRDLSSLSTKIDN